MVDIKKLIKDELRADIEKIEQVRGSYHPKQLIETNYPKPFKRKFLVYENFGLSIEESYFWVKDFLETLGFTQFDKLVDTFTASEQSAMFGSAQQRLSIQQDKAAQYLATVGQMTKQLFQIVREIQLLEERETLYKNALEKKDDGAEKALKGIWIDFVDNGPQGLKAGSVYGLASQLGYTVLPDLFFAAPAALKQEEVEKYVKGLDFNDKVLTALSRKLQIYVSWRDTTYKQIVSKKKFTVQYLRQHYNAIKLYIDWIKPYLRNVKRLGMNPEQQLSADVVGAFEGAVVEIEVLAKKPVEKQGDPHPCILATFYFRTRPVMQTGQDFQRGPLHIGRMEMTLRAYAWTEKEIAEFKKIKQQEDFEMLKSIDSSIEQAMDYLGDSLKKYLSEAGEKFEQEDVIEQLARQLVKSGAALSMEEARPKAKDMIEKKKENKESFLSPVTDVWKGFRGIPKLFMPGKNQAKEARKREEEIKDAKKRQGKFAAKMVATTYLIYKKAHRLFTP